MQQVNKTLASMDKKQLPVRQSDVAIIGAGFSGINIACQLQRKLGVTDYVIYDRAADYGGTWFANRCETRHSATFAVVISTTTAC